VVTADHPPNILSVQSSKGLEFRSVIFIGLGQIETLEIQAAQNMKLFYVRMTRAKERLLITASGKNEFTDRLGAMTGGICAFALSTRWAPERVCIYV
jgi:superfamily I DNA/RNA helicase